MLKIATEYQDFLNFATKETHIAAATLQPKLDSLAKQTQEEADATQAALVDTHLLVPVIGAFSAGKSSLLNTFLGINCLPVAITPETALACELRYGTASSIEAVTLQGEIEHFDSTEFSHIQGRAKEFQYLRLYLNNERLKAIEPLVLVDMPGFDSPLDAHNKAILSYIDRGAHYVVLVSVEEGGLTSRTIRQLDGIVNNGRDFSLCLSKVDLRLPEEVNELREHIADQLDIEFGYSTPVVVLDQGSAQEKIAALLHHIDPEQLFKKVFNSSIQDFALHLESGINAVISTLTKDSKAIDNDLLEISESFNQVERECEERLKRLNEKQELGSQLNKILKEVETSLENNTENFATCMLRNSEEMVQVMNEVIRNTLLFAIRDAGDKLSEESIQEFVQAMRSHVRTDFQLPNDWLSQLLDKIKDPFSSSVQDKLSALEKEKDKDKEEKIKLKKESDSDKQPRQTSPKNKKDDDGKKEMQDILTTVITVVSTRLNPVLSIIIQILPKAIDWAFGTFRENRQREQAIEILRNRVYPETLQKLRPEVQQFLREAQINTINTISQEYKNHLAQQKMIYQDAQRDKSATLEQIAAQKDVLATLKAKIRQKAEVTAFSA